VRKLVLLVAILAMVLGGGSLALAQTDPSSDQASGDQTATNDQTSGDQPATNDQTGSGPTTTNGQTGSGQTATNDQSANIPCGVELFRMEQQELVQDGYPTSVSARARECENLGFVDPYPAPALLGPDGVVYPYDPIEGQYMYFDRNTGLYHILDPASDTVSTYDPASGTFR
jgi:hypothetical protein